MVEKLGEFRETYSSESWKGNPERSLLKRPVIRHSVGRNVQRLGVEEPDQ